MRAVRFVLCAGAILAGGSAFGQGFTPEEAVKRMTLPPGFKAMVVACEPMIRQPVSIEFDNRGRLWVLQYLQYPNPAGLKAVKQDEYLRTVWDRVPEPPPKGPKGADRLTICYDPDENGRFRKSKDFVTGLNLASGFCIGNGGVYIVQPPYLLFYPDKNEDDVPDGDPEVLLTGFGMEDPHAYANSLQWGPDGWLYGAQGSTVTAKIANPANPKEVIEFQQGVWRYHPKTKRFELFAEGGGNIWGLDFDKHGQLIAGTNFGGVAMMHVVQGGYYVKNWTKHGALHNPHAYGYFEHVPYTGFKGGHVTCGGIINQGGAYPKEYEDQYIAGNLLSNAIYWHKMEPNGSTFKASHGGDLLIANDTWFRPVDLTLGPDGSVYVADWYDKRASHLDPIDNWDKTNGRVYKIEYKGTKPVPPFDLRTKTSAELVELLKHPNAWWRRQARQLLMERKDESVLSRLTEMLRSGRVVDEIEALWVINAYGRLFGQNISLGNPHAIAWSIRLIADEPKPTETMLASLRELAETEAALSSPVVACQVTATARRLPSFWAYRLPAITILKKYGTDPYIPNLHWWAIEAHAMEKANANVINMVNKDTYPEPYRSTFRDRLARRYVGEGLDALDPFMHLLDVSIMNDEADSVLRILETYLSQLGKPADPSSVQAALARQLKKHPSDPVSQRILARLGDKTYLDSAAAAANDTSLSDADRIAWLKLALEQPTTDKGRLVVESLKESKSDSYREKVLVVAGSVDDTGVADAILDFLPTAKPAVARRIVAVLLSRAGWAVKLLSAVDTGKFLKTTITLDDARTAAALNDPAVTALVEKIWGKITPATPGEKLARINWLAIAVGRLGKPDLAAGKALFTQHCASCHVMHGEGGKVGPDLTTADRKNTKYMLTQIVDPSSYIRPEYVQHAVTTTDGRKLLGIVSEQTADGITLLNVVDNKPVKTVVPKGQIDDVKPLPTSLMPEKLLDPLTDEQVRDLLGYLASDPPKR
jgi:putative membrane-bound dehydrogenase-like protein